MHKSLLLKLSIIACIASLLMLAACSSNGSKTATEKAPKLPSGIPDLIKLLGDKEYPNRNLVIKALADKGLDAADPLVTALADENANTREGAQQALADIGAPALPVLKQALVSQDSNVRYGVIMALGEIGPPAADAITPLMKDFGATQSMNERVAIIHSSVKIAPTDPQVLSLLQAALVVKDFRQNSLRALGEIGPGAASIVPKILTYLEDKDPQTRFEAVGALAGIGPVEGVVDGLAGRLTDDEARVKLRAAQTLGTFAAEGAGAATALAFALDDKDPEMRQASAKALGEMAPASMATLTKLTNALQDKDPGTRREVANALGKFGSIASGSIAALQKVAASDEFDYVKTAASQAIKAIQGS
jgi:HEAT repeat protein